MEISIKQKYVTYLRSICLVAVVLLTAGRGVYAAQRHLKDSNSQPEDKSDFCATDANDPNGLWWRSWEAAVKNPNDPNELIQAKLNAVITVLQSKELEQTSKEKIIDKIISPFFDFELMSKLVLGRTHWPKLTPVEQKKFTKLFTEKLKKSYLEKIVLYKDEKVWLAPPVSQKTGIYISMDVLSGGEKVTVLYKMRKAYDRWKIYDVEVQGISILLTYRSQFDDILRRGSVEKLFTQLEKSVTN